LFGRNLGNYNTTYNCVDLNSTQSAPVPTTPVTPIATHSFVTITPASSTNNRPIECTGKIAFNKSQDPVKNEFWTVNPDGSNLNNLKFLDSLDGRPVWSPDGKKIAFTLYNLSKGVYEIALTNDPIAGSDYRVVTSNAIFKGWSPDSKWLAFDRAWDLYIIDNEGKNEKKLFDVPDNQLGSVVSWSPNSKSIVFTYGTENSSGIYGTVLARIDINGLNLQTLASSTFPDIMLEPIWSSNGEYISLLKYRDNCKISGYLNFCNEINIIRPDGTELTQHTNNELWETSISWSPDSQKILFVGMSLESSSGVYIINFDGTGLIQLLKDPDLAIASWSPDGKCISMIINYPTGENEEPSPYPKGDIFIMNNDGSGFTRLTNTGVVSAQWIPNGK